MNEKALQNKKNGMLALILTSLGMLASLALVIVGGVIADDGNEALGIPVVIIALVWMTLGWIPYLGLRILKPQEALVLTVFGKYIGTIKGEGFYFVNPFCSSVNPAAKTKLNQSGDVNTMIENPLAAANAAMTVDKKLSLKIMTLNNNRQKINDCLGNPVEIGIAVTWRIVDTAKAVFNVDNYKVNPKSR